jgi:hypothetical protein
MCYSDAKREENATLGEQRLSREVVGRECRSSHFELSIIAVVA